jgi:hypothetical protein
MIVTIVEVGPTRFSASYEGEELCVSRTPLLGAARVLIERGVDPATELDMKHQGSDVVSFRTTVGIASALSVSEPDKGPPHFEPYRERPDIMDQKAASASAVASPAALPGSQLPHQPSTLCARPGA